MNNETLLVSALIAVPTLLYGGNQLRLAIAQKIIDTALAPFEQRIKKFKEDDLITVKPHQLGDGKARFETELKASDHRIFHARKTGVPFQGELPQNFNPKSGLRQQVQKMLHDVRISYPVFLTTALATDLATDAILNEAMLRAFPTSAKAAGVGELSDVMLGPQLKELIDQTGVIDAAADIASAAAGVLGETLVVSTVETVADSNLAIFSLATIAGREIKLINAGHSTPSESALYGVLDYGGRLAGGIIGGKLGAIGGAKAGTFLNPGGGTGVGALVGGFFGAILGVCTAKAVWIKALKAEINSFAADFQTTAATAATETQKSLKEMAQKVQADGKKAFTAYQQILQACPDMRCDAAMVDTARLYAAAYNTDINNALDVAFQNRREILSEIGSSARGQPNFWHNIIGANWIAAAEQQLDSALDKKRQALRPIIDATSENTVKQKPTQSLQFYIEYGYVSGGQTELLSAELDTKLGTMADTFNTTATTWDTACGKAWETAARTTAGTFKKERKKVEDTYDGFRKRLEFLRRAILAKSCRLNPKLI
jgi:hypothetical protein